MRETDDVVIWRHAAGADMVVVSKDEDFYYLATSPGNSGRLLWVRVGNCRRQALFEVFGRNLKNIVEAFESGTLIVELR